MDKNSFNQRPSREGANNPMWGRHHTSITRQKQSDAAKRRYQEYRKALDSQHHVTMDEFLGNNPSIKEYIRLLVKRQIDELLWKDKQVI
ncbi:MAG: hypothetical protein IJV19_04595 [Prevotella sp.]|nr:hypothetical protein [Prevotella sp.]